jgi:predicted RNA-binding Zn-ribbon protein involved in translation (DUF1610 family)
MSDEEPPEGVEPDIDGIDRTCPRCGARMRAIDLGSGAVVLRCPECGQTAI